MIAGQVSCRSDTKCGKSAQARTPELAGRVFAAISEFAGGFEHQSTSFKTTMGAVAPALKGEVDLFSQPENQGTV